MTEFILDLMFTNRRQPKKKYEKNKPFLFLSLTRSNFKKKSRIKMKCKYQTKLTSASVMVE